ncbi:hypothetical protein [Geobacter pickeringii]|uniref:hypothetical protein n=1 Tax=Geobacter pickeringii TaxID=345632 RepID=UPI0009FC9DFC|nr:hypothetical protein [Geobacter pickeringii]
MSSTDPPKKHPCPDCRFCQWCGDDRCSLCLGTRTRGRKMSMEEQIAFYEAVNNPHNGTSAPELQGHGAKHSCRDKPGGGGGCCRRGDKT